MYEGSPMTIRDEPAPHASAWHETPMDIAPWGNADAPKPAVGGIVWAALALILATLLALTVV
jgi:hypothetical protein